MKRISGFSVTELMVVVAIVAILLSIGAPSFRYITNSYRMSAEANGLLGDLMYARSEALREGQTVTVCVSNNGTACTGGGGNWANGWIVFSDLQNNQTVAAGDTVLRIQAGFTGATPDSFNATPSVAAITYNREGFSTTSAGFAGTTMKLHDPTSNAVWSRCLLITAVGTMTVQTHASNPGTCS